MKLSESLSNGIKLISHQLPNTHCVTISINFLVGSLFENDANLGITHLIEHLFFRQFGDLSHKDLFMKTYALGAEIIASTNYDCVSFNITIVPKHFREALAIITKCLTEYHWCESLIDAEKKTVTNEIANKHISFDNWIDSLYFESTPLSRPILGTVDTIKALTHKQINQWKDNYFCPENSCVTIIGNFSNEDYAHSISHLSGFKRFGNPSDNIICYPKNFANRNADNRYTIIDDESDLCTINDSYFFAYTISSGNKSPITAVYTSLKDFKKNTAYTIFTVESSESLFNSKTLILALPSGIISRKLFVCAGNFPFLVDNPPGVNTIVLPIRVKLNVSILPTRLSATAFRSTLLKTLNAA